MHYEITYDKTPEAGRKALIDMIQYIGGKRFRLLARFCDHPKQKFEQIRMVCAFAGVQWRPVKELIKRYHPRCNGGKRIKRPKAKVLHVGDASQEIYDFQK